MNRVLKICCLLYVCVLSFSTGVAQVVDTARWDLNRISSWMLTQIQYPEAPFPGITLTSICSVSPPTCVQASPREIPISSFLFAIR